MRSDLKILVSVIFFFNRDTVDAQHYVSFRCAVLSHFSRVRLFATLWTVTHQAPLSMGFSTAIHSFLATLHGLWDLSPLTRDRTGGPLLWKQSLNHWPRVTPQ